MSKIGQHQARSRVRYFDTLLGNLRNAGFSIDVAGHALVTLDSFIYGFALQQISWPLAEDAPDIAAAHLQHFDAEKYPYLAEIVVEYGATPNNDYMVEFEFGLDLILDGLERYLERRSR